MKDMRKVFAAAAAVLLAIGLDSCNYCNTCSRYDELQDSTFVEEVCDRNQKIQRDQIRIYEKNGYLCE